MCTDKNNTSLFSNILQTYSNTPKNQNIIKLQFTEVAAKTSKMHENKSKRLIFNRKLEREQLPLLVIKFEGVIGVIQKENLFSDQKHLYVRRKLSMMLGQLFEKF